MWGEQEEVGDYYCVVCVSGRCGLVPCGGIIIIFFVFMECLFECRYVCL